MLRDELWDVVNLEVVPNAWDQLSGASGLPTIEIAGLECCSIWCFFFIRQTENG